MADRHGADLACGLDRPTQSRVLDLVGNQRLPSPPCQQIPTSSTSIVMIDKGYVGLRPMEGPGGNAQVILSDPIAVGCKSVNVVEGRIEGY